jgi:polar amino acid transport system substrate-binding protein
MREESFMTGGVTKFNRRILIALGLIVFVLSACVGVPGPELPKPPEPEPLKPSGSLLKPQLRVALSPDFPPLAEKALGQLAGLEVDFARQIGKELGKEIIFIEAPWPELINLLLAERADIIMSGMSITTERVKVVSFTEPYAHVGQMALVRSGDAPSFSSVGAFTNTTSRVGFVQKTTGELAARGLFLKAKLVVQPTIDQGIAALRKGEIDVFIHDAPTVWRIAGNSNERELRGLYWPLTTEPLAWAVRKEDEPLRVALSRIAIQWKESGQLKLFINRWVTFTIWQK